MLKLVCFFYFQVLAVLYFFPWFELTFWEGAKTMIKPTNNAHLDDVNEKWLSRHGVLFFSMVLDTFWEYMEYYSLVETSNSPFFGFAIFFGLLFFLGIPKTGQTIKGFVFLISWWN